MQTILITGASSGVGKALASYLSKEYKVIALARRVEKMEEAFQDNKNIFIYQADISDLNSLETTLDEIIKRHGPILHVINNAGIMIAEQLEALSLDRLQNAININAMGPLFIIKKLLPEMKKNHFGRIINITSGAPLNCFPGYGAYNASKALLNALTVTLAKEVDEHNIKVNLMSPGPVKTEMAPNGPMDPSVCFPTVKFLLNLPAEGETGKFFWLGYEVPLFPDLEGVQWLEGIGNNKLREIF